MNARDFLFEHGHPGEHAARAADAAELKAGVDALMLRLRLYRATKEGAAFLRERFAEARDASFWRGLCTLRAVRPPRDPQMRLLV